MLRALDEGVRRGVTPRAVAAEVERALPLPPRARETLRRFLRPALAARTARLLAADKKGGWVLLEKPGRWVLRRG